MSAATQANPLPNFATFTSKTWIWVGRIVTALVVLFCAFDGLMKVIGGDDKSLISRFC
jgi:hypothetical protein